MRLDFKSYINVLQCEGFARVQEKVIEFSKMSPEELLINTERAIGDASLHDMHTKLIDGGKDLKSKQTDLCAILPVSDCCTCEQPVVHEVHASFSSVSDKYHTW